MKDLGSKLFDTIMFCKTAPVNILLVEDSPADAMLATTEFEGQQCLLDHVWTGEQAIEAIQLRKFDAALIDLVLPGMSGIETAKQLIGYSPVLVIFICSGANLPEGAMKEALGSGFMVLPKPLAREHVAMILNEVKKRTEQKI